MGRVCADKHGAVAIGVTWGVDENEALIGGKRVGFYPGTERDVEIEQGGFESRRIEFWQGAEGVLPFLAVQQDGSFGEVVQAADMVEVEVREDD